ncbi:MAG: hypothetical protein P8R42_10855 [Candidatus Binatia bacterium]|nr:hypothetical protein [Candidatus Binatia bacterium]
MVSSRIFLLGIAFVALSLSTGPAAAIDVIVVEELKDTALKYGSYSGRFITCDIRPPVRIRASYLRYARGRGASDQHLEILSKVFDEGQARTTGLRTGYSKAECEEKLAQPDAQQLLAQLKEWYALPPRLKE